MHVIVFDDNILRADAVSAVLFVVIVILTLKQLKKISTV
jgi:hypothetical protein